MPPPPFETRGTNRHESGRHHYMLNQIHDPGAPGALELHGRLVTHHMLLSRLRGTPMPEPPPPPTAAAGGRHADTPPPRNGGAPPPNRGHPVEQGGGYISSRGRGRRTGGAPRPRTPTPPRPASRTAEARDSTTQTATHRPEADHPRDHRDDDSGHRQSNTASAPRWIRDDSPARTEPPPRPHRPPSAAGTATRATPASTKPAEEHA